MIPLCYGGIDRAYGDISIKCADKILDMVDDYIELVEKTEHLKEIQKVRNKYGKYRISNQDT